MQNVANRFANSPVSMQALHTARSTVAICQIAEKYRVCNPRILFRLKGAGYRVMARLYSSYRTRSWERLWVASTKPLSSTPLPIEWWIGRGKPLNPYLKGLIVALLRKELRPKEIRLVPKEMLFGDGESDILEYTLVHNWMKAWLKWVSWYYTIALSPDVDIRALFQAPLCSTLLAALDWRHY